MNVFLYIMYTITRRFLANVSGVNGHAMLRKYNYGSKNLAINCKALASVRTGGAFLKETLIFTMNNSSTLFYNNHYTIFFTSKEEAQKEYELVVETMNI
jgi:hypothetical protein